jgi:hypothetical protein
MHRGHIVARRADSQHHGRDRSLTEEINVL